MFSFCFFEKCMQNVRGERMFFFSLCQLVDHQIELGFAAAVVVVAEEAAEEVGL